MIVYKITNLLTNLSYIGYTKFSVSSRWSSHCTSALKSTKNRKFYNAIRKYGFDCWTKEIICTVKTASEAKEKEIYYINFFNSYYNGYNATKGGDGNNGIQMSKESNEARSKKLKGIKKSAETIEKFKQKIVTKKTKEKISFSHKGMKKPWVKWTKEQCQRRGMSRRTITKEQYDLMHELRIKGYLIKDISKQVSLSNDMVKKWLKRVW